MFIFKERKMVMLTAVLLTFVISIAWLSSFFSDFVSSNQTITTGTVSLQYRYRVNSEVDSDWSSVITPITATTAIELPDDLDSGDVINLEIEITNLGNKSTKLTPRLILSGEAMKAISDNSGLIQNSYTVFTSKLDSAAAETAKASLGDQASFWTATVEASMTTYAWTDARKLLIDGDHSLLDYEAETKPVSYDLLFNAGVNQNQGTLNYTIYYHADATALNQQKGRAFTINFDLYGIQFRNNV